MRSGHRRRECVEPAAQRSHVRALPERQRPLLPAPVVEARAVEDASRGGTRLPPDAVHLALGEGERALDNKESVFVKHVQTKHQRRHLTVRLSHIVSL